jgi:hypothetical protein
LISTAKPPDLDSQGPPRRAPVAFSRIKMVGVGKPPTDANFLLTGISARRSLCDSHFRRPSFMEKEGRSGFFALN